MWRKRKQTFLGGMLVVGLAWWGAAANAATANASSGSAVPGSASQAGARVVLARMLAAEDSIAVSFTETEVRVSPKRLETTTENVYLQSGRRRVERFEPRYGVTVLVVDDGTLTWTSVTGLRYILREPSRPKKARANISPGLTVADLGTVDLGGRTARVIETVNKAGLRTRLWVDAATCLLLREERYDTDGRSTYSMDRTNVDFAPPESQGRFTFTPRPGARVFTDRRAWKQAVFLRVVAGQVSFAVLVPGYVPSGFAFESGDLIEVAKAPVVVTRFRQGNALLLLFQREASSADRKKPSGWKKVLTRVRGDVVAYELRQGGFVVTLVGPIGEKEAQQVFSSLGPVRGGD